MNLYSNKQRWKIFLLVVALIIAAVTLFYTNNIAAEIRKEEQLKVKLWSEAIQQRAELVNYTQQLFEELRQEERDKADLLANAYSVINDPPDGMDLTFITDFLWSNKTIPVLMFDQNNKLLFQVNVPNGNNMSKASLDSLKKVMAERNPPIYFEEVNHTVYYNESKRFSELKEVMDDLINSFISETVINSASIPVVLTDSTQSKVLRAERIDTLTISNPEKLAAKLASMASQNDPISISLAESGTHFIYYEDSVVLTRLQFYPFVQLILIGVFLFSAYLVFSTFRKAEQNQVWVGMAKETAHQLGTPLSSLMAWTAILEGQGVEASTILELNKDIDRLNTITDRFSKIGSKPDLQEEDMTKVVQQAFDYLNPRISKKVAILVQEEDGPHIAKVNLPLFGWVIENLVKNAADAMEGVGSITAVISQEGNHICIDITDTGKGVPKSKFKTIFEPGYTSKKRGWGLGLSLTKRIVEEYHKGRIFVKRSEIGGGTTFRIMLQRG
jgi:two-component system, sporulation sensor kinase D